MDSPMLIPVRLPADFQPHIVRDDCVLDESHPLRGQACPACGEPLGDDGHQVALVAVGIAPQNRKPTGYTTGAAVAVHRACVLAQPQCADCGRRHWLECWRLCPHDAADAQELTTIPAGEPAARIAVRYACGHTFEATASQAAQKHAELRQASG